MYTDLTLINIFFFLGFITPYVIIVIMVWIFKNNSKRQDITTKNLEKNILEFKNEINRIRTELEWKSEIQSQGHSSVRSHRSEYSNEIETIWNEFVYLFDERRKKNGCSHTKMYDVLSKEIKLSTGTLSGFYRHQKKPHVTSLDKIEAWVNKQEKNNDNIIISSSSSSNKNNEIINHKL